MSTRHSEYAHTAFGESSTAGTRGLPRSRREHVFGSTHRVRTPIGRAERATGSLLGDPEPSVRRPINERPADQKQRDRWFKTNLTARDLMTVCTATLRPEDSIERAARLMCEAGSWAVPVVDNSGRLIGVITNRDITMKLIALGASIPHAQVSDCMTSETFACAADNTLESCVSAMSWHQLRRIPIVDDEHRLLGTISQRDLARYICEHPDRVERRTMADILWALAY